MDIRIIWIAFLSALPGFLIGLGVGAILPDTDATYAASVGAGITGLIGLVLGFWWKLSGQLDEWAHKESEHEWKWSDEMLELKEVHTRAAFGDEEARARLDEMDADKALMARLEDENRRAMAEEHRIWDEAREREERK